MIIQAENKNEQDIYLCFCCIHGSRNPSKYENSSASRQL